jgi:Ca2+-binding EF-hand superfamily protein
LHTKFEKKIGRNPRDLSDEGIDFDQDRDRFITATELKLGLEQTDEEIYEMISEVDRGGDGNKEYVKE